MIDFREILTLVLIFVPLQLLLPQRPHQRIFRRQWVNDVVYLFVNGIVIRIGFFALILPIIIMVRETGPNSVTAFVGGQPIWLQAIAAIAIADIGFYAAHRLFHAVPFLWRFHAIHHSIEELDWLAAHRVHPVDQLFSTAASVLPLFALGFSTEALAIYSLAYLIQSHLIHANVRLDFGPLRWIIASPRFHHWHHAHEPRAYDRNFSGQFLFMDAIFGTLQIPDAMPARYGTDDPVPALYPLQLAWPFLRQSPAAPTAAEPGPR